MARILESNCLCPSLKVVEAAVKVIRAGGVVVAPTDTLYGILADPFNPDAVRKVFSIKRRSPDKPLPLLLAETHYLFKVVKPNPLLWRLAQRFWPGGLTIVAEPADNLPEHMAKWGAIGVRLPDCYLTRLIARYSGGIVVGTSANLSGRENPNTVYIAYSQLGEAVDLYIDGGPTMKGDPSTVVSVVGGELELVREGVVGWREIVEAAGVNSPVNGSGE